MKSLTHLQFVIMIAAVVVLGVVTFIFAFGYKSQPATTTKGCVRAGCSSQLCVESGKASGTITTCEYNPEYACYKTARCERQATGDCGWTTTPELRQCIANAYFAQQVN